MYEVNYPLLALLVGVLGVFIKYLSWRTSKRSVQQHQSTPQSSVKYPDVRLSIDHGAHGQSITIRNLGHGNANNVRFHLEPLDHRSSPVFQSEIDEKIPIKVLPPSSHCGLMLADPDISTSNSFMVHVTWENDDGSTDSIERHMTTLVELGG